MTREERVMLDYAKYYKGEVAPQATPPGKPQIMWHINAALDVLHALKKVHGMKNLAILKNLIAAELNLCRAGSNVEKLP